jgi:hypothetical protein
MPNFIFRWLSRKKHAMNGKITVHSSKDGKLYINIDELMALDSVQELVEKVAESRTLDTATKVQLKEVGSR